MNQVVKRGFPQEIVLPSCTALVSKAPALCEQEKTLIAFAIILFSIRLDGFGNIAFSSLGVQATSKQNKVVRRGGLRGSRKQGLAGLLAEEGFQK